MLKKSYLIWLIKNKNKNILIFNNLFNYKDNKGLI